MAAIFLSSLTTNTIRAFSSVRPSPVEAFTITLNVEGYLPPWRDTAVEQDTGNNFSNTARLSPTAILSFFLCKDDNLDCRYSRRIGIEVLR